MRVCESKREGRRGTLPRAVGAMEAIISRQLYIVL